jgi:hypothetical protein
MSRATAGGFLEAKTREKQFLIECGKSKNSSAKTLNFARKSENANEHIASDDGLTTVIVHDPTNDSPSGA